MLTDHDAPEHARGLLEIPSTPSKGRAAQVIAHPPIAGWKRNGILLFGASHQTPHVLGAGGQKTYTSAPKCNHGGSGETRTS